LGLAGQKDPYSRLYWRFITEYPEVYGDDQAFAAWMRMLMIAEGAHPAPAQMPRSTTAVDKELVVILPGGLYLMRGVHKEIERRAEIARRAALARHAQSNGHANAEQPHNGSNA
jgi:hypothetical protein